MKHQDQSDKHLADAIECFQCLINPNADPKTRERWVAWLGADPDHRAAYKKVETTWRRPIPNDLWPSQKEMDDDDYEADISVQHFHRVHHSSQGRRWADLLTSRAAFAGLGLATVLLTGIVIGVYLSSAPPDQGDNKVMVYRTQRGEQRQITVEDGSVITLGPLSEVRLPGIGRTVQLVRGEAYFSVVHDTAHPFQVLARSGVIRDIGTIFNIALQPNQVLVTVAEGSIAVAMDKTPGRSPPVRVERNQQVAYTDHVGNVAAVDATMATDWTHGRLAYIERPLADVAADLTRFSKIDVTISDPSVGSLRYTGIISVDAIDQWVTSLAKVYPVRAERNGTSLVLRPAAPP